MKRILTLTSNDFYTGISAGSHVDRGGLWSEAGGINVFTDVTAQTADAGLLQTCASPTDISGSISGNPTDYSILGSELWFVTTDGDIASVNMATDTVTVEVDSTGHTFAAGTYDAIGSGCQWFSAQKGAVDYLYYFSNISGTWFVSRVAADGTDDADWTSLGTSTANAPKTRPIVRFKDRVYFGDIDDTGSRNTFCVSSISSDSSSTISVNRNVLDISTSQEITALADDGTFLVIAASESFNRSYYGNTTVYFWDTNQSSYTREFQIPDAHIVSMTRVRDTIYAVGATGLWAFSFQTRPIKIRHLDSSMSATGAAFAYHGSSSPLNNAVLWGGGSQSKIWSFGEMIQGIGVDSVLHQPFENDSDNTVTTMIAADAKFNTVYFGTAGGNLYTWDITSGGSTGQTAESVYIPLQEKTRIKEVEVILGEPLASGDSLNIDLQGDEDNAATDWGTVSFATHGAVQRVNLKNSKEAIENLRLVLNFNGGNVKIKRINVYGTREPVAKYNG